MADRERNESEIVGAPQKCKEDTSGIKCAIFFANKKGNFLRQHFLAQKIKDGRAQITVFSAQKKHQREDCLDEPFACLLPVKDDIYALQLDSSSTQPPTKASGRFLCSFFAVDK